METGTRGAFVISWSQCELDGLLAAPLASLTVGATWRWTGDATLVNGARDIFILTGAVGMDDMRQRAASKLRRVLREAVDFGAYDPENQDSRLFDGAFDVTDGHARYTILLIDLPSLRQPLMMFAGGVPPRDTDLWIVSIQARAVNRSAPAPHAGVICFTPGTRIATEQGPIPVEQLREGDRILTKDNGPQALVWVGGHRLTGARMHAMPELRPVRLRASALGVEVPDDELVVSPQHRIVVRGPVARALFNTGEVLAAARDLVNDRTILVDRTLRCVSYIHLMLESHQVVFANGVETESFHPGAASLEAMDPGQKARLLHAMPGLADNPAIYGGYARRRLSAAEAAILHHRA